MRPANPHNKGELLVLGYSKNLNFLQPGYLTAAEAGPLF